MGLKALVAAFYVKFLSNKKKRVVYMLLEYFSQLYRSIVPTPLWVQYLSDKQPSGFVVAVVITSTYLMVKGVFIFFSVRDVYRAVINLIKYRVSINYVDTLSLVCNILLAELLRKIHKQVGLLT